MTVMSTRSNVRGKEKSTLVGERAEKAFPNAHARKIPTKKLTARKEKQKMKRKVKRFEAWAEREAEREAELEAEREAEREALREAGLRETSH